MPRNDIAKDGEKTRFSKENQPANRGRKKNVFKHYQEKYDLSSQDVNNTIEFLLSQPLEKLQEIIKDPKKPAMVINFATAILTGIKKGDLSAIERMLDRKIGKPKEQIEIKGNINTTGYDLSKLSDEQLEQLENLLSGAISGESENTSN